MGEAQPAPAQGRQLWPALPRRSRLREAAQQAHVELQQQQWRQHHGAACCQTAGLLPAAGASCWPRCRLQLQLHSMPRQPLLQPRWPSSRRWWCPVTPLPAAVAAAGCWPGPCSAGRSPGCPRLAAASQRASRLPAAAQLSSPALAQASRLAPGGPAAVDDASPMVVDGGAGCQPPQPPQHAQPQCLVRVSVRVLSHGRCCQGAALLARDGPAAALGGADTACGREPARLLGFVTSAVPRGAPAGLHPGGLGFCSASELWRLRCRSASPAASRTLRAWLLNPGSGVPRVVELAVLLDS